MLGISLLFTMTAIADIDEISVQIENEENEYTQGEEIIFVSAVQGGDQPYSYNWNFGDASPVSTEISPTRVYEYTGTYTVILTVTDANGLTQTSSKTIIIRDADIDEVQIIDVKGGWLFSATVISTEQVAWSIDITQGFVLMGGHADGITLPEGETPIRLPFSLGFGATEITVNAGGISQTYNGGMVGPFLWISS